MSLPQLDASIPIIDISYPSPEVAQQVLDAASTFGFLYIKNDGFIIPPADIDAMFELSRHFFQSSLEEKSKYAIHSARAGGKNRGWVAMQGESLDPEGQKFGDPKEAFNIAPPNAPYPTLQPLPPTLSPSAHLLSTFQTQTHTLCQKILSLLAQALHIPDPTYFTTRHDLTIGPSGSIFRLLYYPSTPSENENEKTSPAPTKSILAGAHSDYGTLTLLFRLPGQPGLEILPQGSQTWTAVPVMPSPTLSHPPILVNIGDLLSFWTAGLLKSTVHRVVKEGGGERYSMAYFCHPLDSVVLEGVPSPLVQGFVARREGSEELERQRQRVGFGVGEGKVLTAKEHLDRRLRVTYGLGE